MSYMRIRELENKVFFLEKRIEEIEKTLKENEELKDTLKWFKENYDYVFRLAEQIAELRGKQAVMGQDVYKLKCEVFNNGELLPPFKLEDWSFKKGEI
ncbi:MAG: hypothetical protein J6X26_00885 [Bacteroidales bacterium]|nr:hypothetical protein [Bacteroidales bacterium]